VTYQALLAADGSHCHVFSLTFHLSCLEYSHDWESNDSSLP
jgi:hypothetical protein